MLRAVVDTNVWVSALLNRMGAPAQVRAAFVAGRFTLLTSEPLLAELAEVLARPRIRYKYGVTAEDSKEIVDSIRHLAIDVPITGDLHLCRDPDDDVVIETAIRGRARILVSRDDDLKGASDVIDILAALDVEVMSVRRFLTLL